MWQLWVFLGQPLPQLVGREASEAFCVLCFSSLLSSLVPPLASNMGVLVHVIPVLLASTAITKWWEALLNLPLRIACGMCGEGTKQDFIPMGTTWLSAVIVGRIMGSVAGASLLKCLHLAPPFEAQTHRGYGIEVLLSFLFIWVFRVVPVMLRVNNLPVQLYLLLAVPIAYLKKSSLSPEMVLAHYFVRSSSNSSTAGAEEACQSRDGALADVSGLPLLDPLVAALVAGVVFKRFFP